MSPEFTPARIDRRPPPVSWPAVGLVVLAAFAAAGLFWAPLIFGGSLHGHDWTSHHFGYFDWVRIAMSEYGTLPLYMADAWVTPNFVGNAESPGLGPLAWLLLILPTGVYIKLLIVVFTAAGLAGMFLLLRDLGAHESLAVFGAVAFAFGGFFTSHIAVGHHWAMGGWLLPVMLLLYRRAVFGSVAALVAAAVVDALTIMGGQHQPFVWQNLVLSFFAVLWSIQLRSWLPALRWAAIVVGAAALGAVKILPMGLEFADYAPLATLQGLPVGLLLLSLVGPGQSAAQLDPRIVFEYGAGWWEYAFYLGPVALAAVFVGCVAGRRAWPLLAIGIFFLALSLEPGGAWALLEELPIWRSQRCPSRFLFLSLFAFTVVGASGLERLRQRASVRLPRVAVAAAWLLAGFVAGDLWIASRPWQDEATGPAIERVDHRPRPLELRSAGGRARLEAFEPNRLRYRVHANGESAVVLPVRFGKSGVEWSVEADGIEDSSELRLSARQGKLALNVPQGEHEIVLHYRPPGLRAGVALSGVTVAVLLGWTIHRSRSRRGGAQDTG